MTIQTSKTVLAAVEAKLAAVLPYETGINWKQNPYDKFSHIVFGTAASCGVILLAGHPMAGILTATAIGLFKETFVDKNFDKADLASWVVGGMVGAACVSF